MGYSKETERQNKVLGDLLAGREPEKRIMVGYNQPKEKKKDNISKMTKLMQDVRMPLFCKSCDKVMKKTLDDKMWRLFGHCFDCQVKIENKLHIEGTYKEWAKEKIKRNKISFIKDQIQAISEWKDMKAPEFYNQVGVNYPELEKEKWGGDMTQINLMAEEALEEYTKVLNELEESE
tara:strand:+ start:47 stop:577 length:531 start_codon:yes stop_codon:yes gene_type:complete